MECMDKYFNVCEGDKSLDPIKEFRFFNPEEISVEEHVRKVFNELVDYNDIDSNNFMMAVPEAGDMKKCDYINIKEIEDYDKNDDFDLNTIKGMLTFTRTLVCVNDYRRKDYFAYDKDKYPVKVYEFEQPLDIYKYTINPVIARIEKLYGAGLTTAISDAFGNSEFFPFETSNGLDEKSGCYTLTPYAILHLSTLIILGKLAKKIGYYNILEDSFNKYLTAIAKANYRDIMLQFNTIQVAVNNHYLFEKPIDENALKRATDIAEGITSDMLDYVKEMDIF